MAISGDQRAVQFCAALGVVVMILSQVETHSGTEMILKLEAMATMLVAAVMAAYSSRPVRSFAAGGPPRGFGDYFHDEYCNDLISVLLVRNDEAIARNETQIRLKTDLFKKSMIVAGIGIAVMIGQLWIAADIKL